jgi:hypothetical protein
MTRNHLQAISGQYRARRMYRPFEHPQNCEIALWVLKLSNSLQPNSACRDLLVKVKDFYRKHLRSSMNQLQ